MPQSLHVEVREVAHKREAERDEVSEVFDGYGLSKGQIAPVLDAFEQDKEAWIDLMMRFELGLERPDPKRPRRSALQTTLVGGLAAGAAFGIARAISG